MTAMGPTDSFGRVRVRVRVWVDALTYAAVVAALATLGSLSIGIATGGGLVRGKIVLFVVGWGLMAYATVQLWPSSPEDVNGSPEARTGESLAEVQEDTRLQSFVRMIPPNRWLRSPRPDRRLSIDGKLFLASLLVLAVSFVMEVVFGIT